MNTNKYTGVCSQCGKSDTLLTVIDDVDHVCDDCLEDHFTLCDECGEYYGTWSIKFYYMKDGRTLCEYCGEDADEEDVDFIGDNTQSTLF